MVVHLGYFAPVADVFEQLMMPMFIFFAPWIYIHRRFNSVRTLCPPPFFFFIPCLCNPPPRIVNPPPPPPPPPLWCGADIGWIVGHSYQAYGPLMAGVTQLIREGTPDFPNGFVTWDMIEKYRVVGLSLPVGWRGYDASAGLDVLPFSPSHHRVPTPHPFLSLPPM